MPGPRRRAGHPRPDHRSDDRQPADVADTGWSASSTGPAPGPWTTASISPQVLNDDRLGRALDAIAPHLDQVAGTVGATAITQFGVDVSGSIGT